MNRRYLSKIIMKPIKDDTYVSKLPVIKHIVKKGELVFDSQVTFFVGENGTGKSTLIEAIAVACRFNAEGGSKNFNFTTKNSTSSLSEYITVAKSAYEKDGFFLRAESFYNVASNIEELDKVPGPGPKIIEAYGGISLHEQSHGESFLSLAQKRFRGNGLYILDEPEAALSPSRQMTLLAAMGRLVRENSQFIIATHSPILLAFPNAVIYEISESGIEKKEYEQCEHYKLTKQFLSDYPRMLKYLLED